MSSILTDLPRVSPDPLPTTTDTAQPNQFYDDMMRYLGQGDLAIDEYEPNQSFHQPTTVHGGAGSSITAPPVAANEGLSSSPERDDADDDMIRLIRRGDLAFDEFEYDLMSTGDAYEHLEGLPSSSERDDALLISDDNDLMSLIQGNFGEEDYLMSTGARDYDWLAFNDMMSLIRVGFAEEDFMYTGYQQDSMATPQSDEGLPEEVIATFLKTMTACDGKLAVAGGGVCAVCLDDVYEEDRAVGVLGCRHGFHGDCIGDWLRKKNNCPLCRAIAVKI